MTRQSSLPRPTDARGAGARLSGNHTGRVTAVNDDGTVNVMLDDGTPVKNVLVGCRDAGPDRDDWSIPPKRSLVVVGFANDYKQNAFVLCVLRRPKSRKPPAPTGARRRIHPSGTHTMLHDNGAVEVRWADGTFFTIGPDAEPAEDHTGQDRESDDGNPYNLDPAPKSQEKPKGWQLNVKMPDGTLLKIQDKKVTVEAASGVLLKSNVEIQGDLDVKGQVKATGDVKAGPLSTSLTGHMHTSSLPGTPTSPPLPG